ncbi:MAG: hypothetical protein LBQ77_05965 [Treponema sp.]|jgi:hypothetical protein|nr:hypothetical protein [Treponema sp.]
MKHNVLFLLFVPLFINCVSQKSAEERTQQNVGMIETTTTTLSPGENTQQTTTELTTVDSSTDKQTSVIITNNSIEVKSRSPLQSHGARQITVGGGFEMNRNTRDGIAGALVANVDYGIVDYLAIGLRNGVSYNFDAHEDSSTITNESEIFVKFYPFDLFKIGINNIAPFAQGDIGLSVNNSRFENNESLRILFGGTIGVRFPFYKIYLEPYMRFGYPFQWAVGFLIGGTVVRFPTTLTN